MLENSEKRDTVYFIGGVNGVGKSTFLTELSTRNPEFEVIKGSAIFMEWLGIKPGDYDSLRTLSDDYKRKEFDSMMSDLLSKSNKKGNILLIDAHYFHYKRGEMLDTTGEWIREINALFVITADTESVFERISSDSKERDLFPIAATPHFKRKMLENYLLRTILKAQELSERYGVPYFILENRKGDLEATLHNFLDIHGKIR